MVVWYTYAPRNLQIPGPEQRVSHVRYRDALLAQRAAKLVAKNARRLRTCLNAGQSNPRRCDLNYRTRTLTLRAGKYRVWIKTAFSYDSRDVVAGRDGIYRVRNVIHRQAGVGN